MSFGDHLVLIPVRKDNESREMKRVGIKVFELTHTFSPRNDLHSVVIDSCGCMRSNSKNGCVVCMKMVDWKSNFSLYDGI